MSNFGQAALTIVGAVAGFVIPGVGWALGATIGSIAGQALFPTDLGTVSGPRLNDLNVQSSAIGAPITRVWGTYAVAGNVIWSSGLIETVTKKKTGGKGGPSQTTKTYSYSVDCAVGVCEVITGGIRKVWADAKVIYDLSPQGADESDTDYQERLATSEQTAASMTVYLGDEAQLPDPTIESYVGVGDTLAYRGLCYVVFNGLQLELFGNRIPNFKFEVFNGTYTEDDCTTYSNEILLPWVGGDDPRNPLSPHRYYLMFEGSDYDQTNYSGPVGWTTDIDGILNGTTGRSFNVGVGFTTALYGVNTSAVPGSEASVGSDPAGVFMNWSMHLPSAYEFHNYPSEGRGFCEMLADAVGNGVVGVPGMFGHTYGAYGPLIATSSVCEFLPDSVTTADADFDFAVVCSPNYLQVKGNRTVEVRRLPRAPLDTVDDPDYRALPGADGYFQHIDTGEIIRGVTWTYDSGTTYKVLQIFDDAGAADIRPQYPLNPTLPLGHANYNDEAFWTAAYNEAVTAGRMAAGLTYGVDYPVAQGWGYIGECTRASITTDCVQIADIVEDICNACGIPDTDIDTSDLTTCIHGYAIGRVTNGREGIKPLTMVGLFDGVESGTQLKFIERGHATVATLTDDDLAAHPAGDKRPTPLTVVRTQEVELPRALRLHYCSPDRAYEVSQQEASRTTVHSELIVDVEVAVAMTDDEAKSLAWVLLYDLWTARNACQFATNVDFLQLEPTDCVDVPVDGETQRMRITADTFRIGGIKAFECVRDDLDVYALSLIGAVPTGSGGGPVVAPVCGTDLILIDIPGLREQDRDAGYYAALAGQCDSWQCAAVYRSGDGGVDYEWVGETTIEATTGVVRHPLAGFSSPVENWLDSSLAYDTTSTLEVELRSGGTLESVTDAQIENGANTAVVGVDGRWEVIQFKTAVLLSGTTWELTNLIRGEVGTDAYIGTGEVGDDFVLMTETGAILRIAETQSGIGIEKLFKPVSCGQTLESAEAQAFTSQGLSYRPTTLGGLDDTADIETAVEGDMLEYDGTSGKWRPVPQMSFFEGENIKLLYPTSRGIEIKATGIAVYEFTGDTELIEHFNGMDLLHPEGAGAGDVVTIPHYSTVELPVGFAVVITNLDTTDVGLQLADSSDHLIWLPDRETGARNLASGACATLRKVFQDTSESTWVVTGVGIA